MEPKAQAAERLLRGLGVAVKTFALYPLPHPVTARTIESLLTSLRGYTEAHGPVVARVSKHGITVDGMPFKSGQHANLAFYLFTRKIAQIKILPAVSGQALGAFIAAVGRDRASLEADGGVRHILRQAGVGNIQVVELMVEQEEEGDSEPLDLSAVFEMLGRGRASPQERERIIEILRGGAEQALKLLESIYAMAGGTLEEALEDDQVEQVYQALRYLDRLVLDEPFEDQPQLYAHLAGAQVAMREPLRTALIRTLAAREGSGSAIRLLGSALSAAQLAHLVEGSIAGGNVAQQVAVFLRALCADRQKARAVLAILDARLRPPDRTANWLTDEVWPNLRPQTRREPEIPWEFETGNGQPPQLPPGVEHRLSQTRRAGEVEAGREVVLTLVDMLRNEPAERNRKEIDDIADSLAGYLGELAEQQEFALLRSALEGIREIAASEGGLRRSVAAGLLKKTAEGPMLGRLLSELWTSRGTVTEREIRDCLEPLSDCLLHPLVQALGKEQRGGARAMLCDLLIDLYGDRIDDLAAFVSDSRWYLVRNIANILGRVRNPQAVTHLNRLVTHPDYRVRRETLNALEAIGTPDAHTVMGGFLDDPDERLRLRAIQSMDTWEVWRAMPRLLAIIDQRGPFVRQFAIKRAALEALARLGARQSLSAVKRIAGLWYLWGRDGRALRRAAAQAAASIEGMAPLPDRRPIADDDEDALP